MNQIRTMKSIAQHKTHVLRTGCLAAAVWLFSGTAEGTVTFTAGSPTAVSGSPVTVPISVSGFANVGSFQFDLSWTASVIDFSSVGNVASVLQTGTFDANEGTPGTLTVLWYGNGSTLTEGSTAFSVVFDTPGAPGSSSGVSFTGDQGVFDGSAIPQPLTFSLINGTVQVVPEPVNLALGAFGVIFAGAGSFAGSAVASKLCQGRVASLGSWP